MIRLALSGDWSQIREICCLTGRGLNAIEDQKHWPSFGELWIGPYQKLLPEWTWVALSEDNPEQVVGYLTGCPDTDAFERRKKFLGLEKNSTLHFQKATLEEIAQHYPAHLHINLRKEARGKKLGQKLITAYLNLLQSPKCGVHVFCSEGPVRFYQSCGFRLLEQKDAVFAMGLLR